MTRVARIKHRTLILAVAAMLGAFAWRAMQTDRSRGSESRRLAARYQDAQLPTRPGPDPVPMSDFNNSLRVAGKSRGRVANGRSATLGQGDTRATVTPGAGANDPTDTLDAVDTTDVADTAAADDEPNVSGVSPLPPPPAVAQLRAEVAENPHVTPPSVLSFAQAWAQQMQAARSDAGRASRLMAQAENWVGSDADVAPVWQAMCLNYTELLVKAHPELNARYINMRGRADPYVVRLAEL